MASLLEEDIEALQELDGQRERCRGLLEEAAWALINWAHTMHDKGDSAGDESDPDWASAKDDVERAMVLRSLNVLKRHSVISLTEKDRTTRIPETATALRARLSATNLASLYKAAGARDKEKHPHQNDRIPVFRACHIIQALVEDADKTSGPFCAASLQCLYRLMTDIYAAEGPEWRIGGVSASLDAPQSAFITREAVRSILLIRQSLVNTAKLIDELHRADIECHASESAPHTWRTRMSELRRTSFKTSYEARWPHLLNGSVKIEGDDWIENVRSAVVDQLRHHWYEFRRNLYQISPRPPRNRSDPLDPLVPLAIHNRVIEILHEIHDTAQGELNARPDVPSRDYLRKISAKLKEAAAGLLRIVEPSEVYLETVLIRAVSSDTNRTAISPDAAQAALAAAALTEIRLAKDSFDPDDLHLRSAMTLAVGNLSEQGILQSDAPFDVAGKGYRLLPQSAETIRAICGILSFSSGDCGSQTARKLVRYFLETTRADRPGARPGWHSDIERPKHGKTEVWATALAFYALLDLRSMLDKQINRRVLDHFTVRYPEKLKLELDQLFWPDTTSQPESSLGEQLHAMRKHVEGSMRSVSDFSLVLYGPPGTGKSTLLEALAKSCRVPLVEITPSDILIGGSAQTERHSRLVFSALSMLTQCVILFDEFDSILYSRSADEGPPRSELQFLTPGLLPKLKLLHDRAAKQRLAYALATNYISHLDSAAIRSGRFDRRLGVYPPDLLSRVGRLATEMQKYCEEKNISISLVHRKRMIYIINRLAGHGLAALGKPGWFTSPSPDADIDRTLFGHILDGTPIDFPDQEPVKPARPDPSKTPQVGLDEWDQWDDIERLDKSGARIDTEEWVYYVPRLTAVVDDWHVKTVGRRRRTAVGRRRRTLDLSGVSPSILREVVAGGRAKKQPR